MLSIFPGIGGGAHHWPAPVVLTSVQHQRPAPMAGTSGRRLGGIFTLTVPGFHKQGTTGN